MVVKAEDIYIPMISEFAGSPCVIEAIGDRGELTLKLLRPVQGMYILPFNIPANKVKKLYPGGRFKLPNNSKYLLITQGSYKGYTGEYRSYSGVRKIIALLHAVDHPIAFDIPDVRFLLYGDNIQDTIARGISEQINIEKHEEDIKDSEETRSIEDQIEYDHPELSPEFINSIDSIVSSRSTNSSKSTNSNRSTNSSKSTNSNNSNKSTSSIKSFIERDKNLSIKSLKQDSIAMEVSSKQPVFAYTFAQMLNTKVDKKLTDTEKVIASEIQWILNLRGVDYNYELVVLIQTGINKFFADKKENVLKVSEITRRVYIAAYIFIWVNNNPSLTVPVIFEDNPCYKYVNNKMFEDVDLLVCVLLTSNVINSKEYPFKALKSILSKAVISLTKQLNLTLCKADVDISHKYSRKRKLSDTSVVMHVKKPRETYNYVKLKSPDANDITKRVRSNPFNWNSLCLIDQKNLLENRIKSLENSIKGVTSGSEKSAEVSKNVKILETEVIGLRDTLRSLKLSESVLSKRIQDQRKGLFAKDGVADEWIRKYTTEIQRMISIEKDKNKIIIFNELIEEFALFPHAYNNTGYAKFKFINSHPLEHNNHEKALASLVVSAYKNFLDNTDSSYLKPHERSTLVDNLKSSIKSFVENPVAMLSGMTSTLKALHLIEDPKSTMDWAVDTLAKTTISGSKRKKTRK